MHQRPPTGERGCTGGEGGDQSLCAHLLLLKNSNPPTTTLPAAPSPWCSRATPSDLAGRVDDDEGRHAAQPVVWAMRPSASMAVVQSRPRSASTDFTAAAPPDCMATVSTG